MKYARLLLLFLFALAACNRSSDRSHDDHDMDMDDDGDGPNQALYNQVNDLHEDVMFKMTDLYTLKQELEKKLADTKDLPDAKKADIGNMIAGLDSADHAMREWMHGWMRDTPDSTDDEKMREYYETEMEGIKKVSEQTNDAIAKAKEELGKK